MESLARILSSCTCHLGWIFPPEKPTEKAPPMFLRPKKYLKSWTAFHKLHSLKKIQQKLVLKPVKKKLKIQPNTSALRPFSVLATCCRMGDGVARGCWPWPFWPLGLRGDFWMHSEGNQPWRFSEPDLTISEMPKVKQHGQLSVDATMN